MKNSGWKRSARKKIFWLIMPINGVILVVLGLLWVFSSRDYITANVLTSHRLALAAMRQTSDVILEDFDQTIDTITQDEEMCIRDSPQGDQPNNAHPGGRPVTEDIGIVGKVLFWYVGSGQTGSLLIVHSDGISRPNDKYLRGVKVVTDNVVHVRSQVQGPFSQAKSFAKDI